MLRLFVKTFFSIIVIVSIFVAGCDDDEKSVDVEPIDVQNNVTYDEFIGIVKGVSQQLVIPGFSNKYDSLSEKTVVLIGPKSSFASKNSLTLTGGKDDLNSTQHFIYFHDSKNQLDVYIDFIYLKNYVGNDTVFWEVRERSNSTLTTLKKQSQSILTYKNVLIEVSAFSESADKQKLVLQSVEKTLQNLVEFLKKQ